MRTKAEILEAIEQLETELKQIRLERDEMNAYDLIDTPNGKRNAYKHTIIKDRLSILNWVIKPANSNLNT